MAVQHDVVISEPPVSQPVVLGAALAELNSITGEIDVAAIQKAAEEEHLLDHLLGRAEWLTQRGYYLPAEALPGYGTYSDDDLIEMAKLGDLSAALVAAKRLHRSDPDKAEPILYDLLVRGTTSSVRMMSDLYRMRASRQAQSPKHAKSFHVAGAAWGLFGRLRGDYYEDSTAWIRSALDESEIEMACNEAIRLYDELSTERAHRGLGVFDDSYPELHERDIGRTRLSCSSWSQPLPKCTPFSFEPKDAREFIVIPPMKEIFRCS